MTLRSAPWLLVSLLWTPTPTWAADPPSSRSASDIKRLVHQLDAADPAKRDQAEETLLHAGPATIDLLPDIDDPALSAEQKLRLGRLLPQLQEARAKATLDATRLTIPGQPIELSKLLQEIVTQTGNKVVDLRGSLEQDSSPLSIDSLPPELTFWEVLQWLEEKKRLIVYPNQEGPAVGLAEGPPFQGPNIAAGPLRLFLERVAIRHDFANSNSKPELFLDLAIDIEPRLRPLQFQWAASDVDAIDNQGNRLHPSGPDRQHLTLDEHATRLQATLRLEAPPRSATHLDHVTTSIEIAVAAEATTFLFEDLAKSKNVHRQKQGRKVIYRGFDAADPGTWAIQIIVTRDDDDPESHLLATVGNDVTLISPQGERFQADGGMNSQDLGDGQTEFEHIFVDLPGKIDDYKLEVRVPGRIVRATVPFTFRTIKLP